MRVTKTHHFVHGDFGYYADWFDADDIWWDADGSVEPTKEDIKDARDHWGREGLDAALRDAAEDEADHRGRIRSEED